MSGNDLGSHIEASFFAHRKLIGLLGIIVPIILLCGDIFIFGADQIRSSLSAYYHSQMTSVFSAIICVMGVFLITYKGYDKKDYIVSTLAGVGAIGLGLFPTAISLTDPLPIHKDSVGFMVNNLVHLSFVFLFFASLAYMSYFQFTKTNHKNQVTNEKTKRNIIYKLCALVMVSVGMILLLIKTNDYLSAFFLQYKPVFYGEVIAIWAFGVSWAIKGQAMLKDHHPIIKSG